LVRHDITRKTREATLSPRPLRIPAFIL
jgi:hypothetical protein